MKPAVPGFPLRLLLPTAILFGCLGVADAIAFARAAMRGALVAGDWMGLAFAVVYVSGAAALLVHRRRLARAETRTHAP